MLSYLKTNECIINLTKFKLCESGVKFRYIDNIKLQSIIPNRNQPRQKFDAESMQELIDSIDQHGILQPITVRELESNNYELIAGERRLRAAKSAGLKSVPGYIIKIENEPEKKLKTLSDISTS